MNLKDAELFGRARKGDVSVLTNRRASMARDSTRRTPLHWFAAYAGQRSLPLESVERFLAHPKVAAVKDFQRSTPLDLFISVNEEAMETQ